MTVAGCKGVGASQNGLDPSHATCRDRVESSEVCLSNDRPNDIVLEPELDDLSGRQPDPDRGFGAQPGVD